MQFSTVDLSLASKECILVLSLFWFEKHYCKELQIALSRVLDFLGILSVSCFPILTSIYFYRNGLTFLGLCSEFFFMFEILDHLVFATAVFVVSIVYELLRAYLKYQLSMQSTRGGRYD